MSTSGTNTTGTAPPAGAAPANPTNPANPTQATTATAATQAAPPQAPLAIVFPRRGAKDAPITFNGSAAALEQFFEDYEALCARLQVPDAQKHANAKRYMGLPQREVWEGLIIYNTWQDIKDRFLRLYNVDRTSSATPEDAPASRKSPAALERHDLAAEAYTGLPFRNPLRK